MLNNNLENKLRLGKENTQDKSFDFGFGNLSEPGVNTRKIEISSLYPAPSEWNFYKPISDDKMTELLESILSNGLLVPIIVWEKDDGYMILAGHNRKKAYEILYNTTKDDKYKLIDAIVKGKDEITEYEAREIIIDTNWVQRQLSPIEKSKTIIEKYTVLQSKSGTLYGKRGEGKIRDIIAKEYGLSGRQIDNYKRLSNLIPEIQVMVGNGAISHSPASDIAVLEPETQKWIYDNYRDKIKSKYTRKINSYMDKNLVKKIFTEDIVNKNNNNYIKLRLNNDLFFKYNNCSEEIKARFEADFQIFFEEWIKNKK